MIYEHLFARVKGPAVVRAGLIGAGDFGRAMVTQAPLVPRLEIPAVADLNVEAGREAFRQAGYPDERIAVCESPASALRALESGKMVVVQDASLLMDLPLAVIVSATRKAEAGARFAAQAIHHGKHVVMVDKEADSVVGPLLKRLADRAGVVYTTDDGDQMGLLMGLTSWARTLGFEVLCGGRFHSFLYDPATATVSSGRRLIRVAEADCWALGRIPGGEAPRYYEARRRLFGELQAEEHTGDAVCHLAVMANGTGLLPDAGRGDGYLPVVRLTEIPEVLCPAEEGGILRGRGVLDTVTLLTRPDEADGGGGVYAVVGNPDACSRAKMVEKGLCANSRGTAMLIYRPYHLCGAETAMSILCAGLLGVPTGSAEILPRVDMAVRVTRDLRVGTVLGDPEVEQSGFGREPEAFLAPGGRVESGRALPFFMVEGCRLVRDVSAGTVLTREMVEPPRESALWAMRREQDELFFGRER